MSRSYKQPWIKDGSKDGRQLHHKAMRAMQRDKIREYFKQVSTGYFWYHYDLEPEFKHRYAITNPYDICDYRYWSKKPSHRRK